jgi:tripartite-type tricarboxylate transporter receptor subunit TctC
MSGAEGTGLRTAPPIAIFAVCAAIAGSPCALAQTASAYPSKLVRFISPVAPGGNQATVARAVETNITAT